MEGIMYLHHPHYRSLKNLISNKRLGKIRKVMCSFLLPPLEVPGYREQKKLGASAIYDLGIYPISLILNLFHGLEIEIKSKDIKHSLNKDYDISGKAVLNIQNNIDCHIAWAYNKTYLNELTIYGEDLDLYSQFVFSKDSSHKAHILLTKDEKLIEDIEIRAIDHFELMLKSFHRLIVKLNASTKKPEANSILELSSFLSKLIK
tara:strand:+ start:22 stop:633 length:612 start_codon:yes stop_codon:yes gene_type:complete